ncbi:myosin XVB [Dryobates pubescens]|uniref:myosin XVB n=1 Tax=Dryobates pubescens TaxID=118200 RepID=UPI0023B8EFD3|nr:myosin XVB [Dryobates pubescens]
MPPSKTQHKKVGKEKVLDGEKKANSPRDAEIHCRRRREAKSRGQQKGNESLPEEDDTFEENPSKSQKLVRLQGSKENGHKKLFQGRRAYKRTDKREPGSGSKCGQQLAPKLEGQKGEACKQQAVPTGQESEDCSDEEEKAPPKSKGQRLKRSAEESLLETSGNSDSSNKGHRTHKKGAKETVVDSTASSEEKSSSSEEDGVTDTKAMPKDSPVAEKKGSKELLEETNESVEAEMEQVTTEGKNEPQDEGTDFAGLKAEEKMKNQDAKPRQLKSILRESSEEEDDVSIAGTQSKKVKNEVGKGNTLEKNKVQDVSKDAHDSPGSSGEGSTKGSIDRGKENATKPPLPTAVKAKLHLGLSKGLQGTEQEEKGNDEGKALEGSLLLAKQRMTLKDRAGKCETAEQDNAVGQSQGDSLSDFRKRELAAMMLAKKCSSQSQILLSLKNKHKNVETKLLTSCKPNPVQMALETNSDLKNVESICSKPVTLETLSTQKEPNIAGDFGGKRFSLSNISSCSTTTTKKSSDKQVLGKKKNVGGVELSSGHTLEAGKVAAEAPSEKADVHDGRGAKNLHARSAFRKVTSWLGQKPAKNGSLKARLLSVARAIGISKWILKRFGKRKRRSKPFRFRITIENLSKWAVYKEPHLASSHLMKVCKDQWEAEDITDNTLEMEFRQKQTYIGQILISVNPFKDLSIYSEDVATKYHQGTLSRNAPHIFAIAEMAYRLSQSSEQEQCVFLTSSACSGRSGSGKTEAAKAIVQYLTMLYQRSDSHRTRQPCSVLPILESFGNARTILNDNSSRFGKLLNVHLQHGVVVGTSISQYLLEKSRVVFQARGERNFHVFYELLAGLPVEQKEELYLQEAESYFYLNQGRACDILGKEDSQDFLVLVQALEGINLSDDQLTSTWAVLAAILQLGNICFTSYEKESYEHAAIASDAEIQIVANLLRVSADFLQSAVTHRVTVTSYDRIFTPLSVEGAIDARDSIAKTLYYLLFEWLLLQINEWLAPGESDCALGIVDIHGKETAVVPLHDLGVNSLEQLCINFANEHLQQFFSQTVIAQEEEEYSQEQLAWIPVSKMYSESCLDFIAAKPHGILCILDDQTSLTQATDHTFLQKCHYHHENSPWYTKPKLPLPVFTVKHYAGPVTYQVHKFLNKNRDQLRPEVLDIFSQSRLKVVSHIFQKAKAAYSQQRELGGRGKGLKPQASTLVSKFQQSLQDLTARLRRSHAFFIWCITPNPQKLSNLFDVEHVACQLRHSGILEAIHIRKEGYPVRLPFHSFLARYGLLAGRRHNCLEEREGCLAVLSHVVGNPSELYQIGVTKVFLKEKARQLLERRWNQRLAWAIVTLQRNFRCLLRRRRLRVLQEKVTVIQAHFRGYQARKRYRRLKKALVQFNTMILISRSLIQRRKHCQLPQLAEVLGPWMAAGLIAEQELEERKRRRFLESGDTENSPSQGMDVELLEIPAEFAALLQLAEGWYQAQANQITEALPPEVRVKDDLSLPPNINSYPFSSFIKSHFQKTDFPAPGQPLQHPLTQLDAEYQESALEVNKLILRFIGDKNLQGWQEVLLGNYIAARGLNSAALRNEIFSQVVAQAWKNPDMEHSQRAWVLMATLLSCFPPSPALEKPLLKFVSDHGMEGYSAVCQHKILTAAQHRETDSALSRAYPPTQLEWTANQRRGRMVLDVHTFNEEKFSAEVESWMTGEQYAGWILSARGCDKKSRGWSISMFTGNTWQDLLGCDFVLDLIGEMEDVSNLISSSQSSPEYPITPERDRSFHDLDSIPPAPGIQAPAFPPPSLPPEFNSLHPDSRFGDDLRTSVGLDHYVDDLFNTVLHQGSRVPITSSLMQDMENREVLTGRMKGGGKIGPPQRGIFPSTGFSGATQAPVYQPMPSMLGMPAAMPMMPAAGGIAPMPAVIPAVDPAQLAAQQQAFINQQAMLMAQQMTLQAMTLSQQQQQQQQQRWQKSLENSRPRVYEYTEDQSSSSEDDEHLPTTFQEKREYFQKKGEQKIRVKKIRPASKAWTPPANPQPEQEEEKKKKEQETRKEEKPRPKPEAAPAPALLPPEPKPKKQTPKPKREPPVVKPSGPELRPEPSREIRNIIKMYQSRPAPEPQPIIPARVSKPFIKKNDPKNEALAKLGMMNLPPPKSPSPLPEEKKIPPPTKPKPSSTSSSIKEKQLPLLSIFSQPITPPAAPPLPPPLPSPLSELGNQDWEDATGKDFTVTMTEDDDIKTQLYKLATSVSFSYANPAWKLFLRKEVFYPKENFSHPYCLNLLCEQIMRDTFSDSCFRISREEKRKMKDLLMELRVGSSAQSILEDGIKKRIVLAARDNWANYFSRLFPVHGENGSDVQILGVSHRGMRLLKVVKAAGYKPEHLKILRSYSFADVLSVELKGSSVLEFSLKTEQLSLRSPKAPRIKAMVELFIQELRQDTNYVVALRSYISDDKSLLSFKKGDLIELLPMQGMEPGWQFGSTGGRCGIFPTSLVQLAAAPDYLSISMDRRGRRWKGMKVSSESRNTSRESPTPSLTSEPNSIMLVPAGDNYTMVDFATAYFRDAQSTQRLKAMSAEKKSVADLVQHTKVPIQESLLQYSDSDLNELATKNFKTLMQFMGDQPKLKNQKEAECIYEILQLCKEKESLHDEIYCQVIKQVSHNPNQESVLRGWLLLNLLTGYYLPSNILMPYATKFLQLASSDPSSTHHDIAKICQSNLRKNFMFGGRRHLPFPVELEALLKGRSARRLTVLMPGGVEYITKIQTFTVAKELLQEICEKMGAGEQEEIQEFVLIASRSNGNNLGRATRPIRPEEYLHDYLLEDKLVTVTLRRLLWRTPLHFENQIYTDIHYGQILRDYLDGRILLGRGKEMEMEWKEALNEYTPKSLHPSLRLQALESHVGTLLRTRQPLQPKEAKIQFIEQVMKLPFFGYNTYLVERVSNDTISVPCFFGVNKEEIIAVDSTTQEVSCIIPLKELQQMRILRPVSEGGLPGIELDYGSADSPKAMWLELSQAKELYHTITAILDRTVLHP